jgi:hypothetical protein
VHKDTPRVLLDVMVLRNLMEIIVQISGIKTKIDHNFIRNRYFGDKIIR